MNCMKTYRERERKKIINNLVADANERFMEYADLAIMFTLHFEKGYGAKRIYDFFRTLQKTHKEMIDTYRRNGDDTHYFAMKKWLKDDGIDYDELKAKWESEVKNEEDESSSFVKLE